MEKKHHVGLKKVYMFKMEFFAYNNKQYFLSCESE